MKLYIFQTLFETNWLLLRKFRKILNKDFDLVYNQQIYYGINCKSITFCDEPNEFW